MTDYNRAQDLCQKSRWPSWAPVPDKPTVSVNCKATLNQLTIQSPGREIIEEEGGELDSHEEVRLSFSGPGEIKRREVSRWTLTTHKKLGCLLRVQASSLKRREVSRTLSPDSPGQRDKSRVVELGSSGKLDFFRLSCSPTAVLRTLSSVKL